MTFRHVRNVAFSIALLLVLGAVLMGGMNRENPLEEMNIIQWGAGVPHGAEYFWQPQFQLGANDWIAFNVPGVEWDLNDCLAYAKGIQIKWRACFVDSAGEILKLEDETDACNEAGVVAFTEPCTRILDLSGTPFAPDHVARWNAERLQP